MFISAANGNIKHYMCGMHTVRLWSLYCYH